eukprot:7379811-Lingulodinium_polyedra.AAC.1
MDPACCPFPGEYPGATQPNWASVWVHLCETRQANLTLGLERVYMALAALLTMPEAARHTGSLRAW